MARMITGDELTKAVKDGTFIKRGDPAGVEGVKYDFHLSGDILKAEYSNPIDATKLSEKDRGNLAIESGEVVFVLTEEELDLPRDVVAQLSPKRKLSHAGVLTLGGFCIDPGYKGRLVLGLYNFSSTPFPLRTGKKVVAATFFQLEGSETGTFPVPDPIHTFPEELMSTMQKYRPVTAQALADTVQRLQMELTAIRDDIRSHSDWYKRFEESLGRHDKQIGDLLKGLEDEREARRHGDDRMTNALHSFERKFDSFLAWVKGAAWMIGVPAGIGISILVAWIIHKLWP